MRRALVPVARTVLVSEPKTAHGRRSIALDERTVAVLRAHAATPARRARKRGRVERDGARLHPPRRTGPAAQLGEPLLCAGGTKAKLPEIRLHDLRHTHATLALRAGIHPKVVSERLGHATVAITLDTYSHAIPALQEEAAERIAGLVFAGK